MTYETIVPATFLARPNRFIAQVALDGREETVHVKNTGRCRELLVPGNTVWLAESHNPARKTRFDLVAVDKAGLLINMDAQAPNQVFYQWALAGHFIDGLTLLRPETSWGSSRFDFYWEAAPSGTALESSPLVKGFVEVKGVTLEQDGLALFPDAPTQRGVKHLRELALCHQAGYQAAVCFVIQMEGMAAFSPNDETHPQFGQALREAAQAGVKVLALECHVAPDSLAITGPIPVQL